MQGRIAVLALLLVASGIGSSVAQAGGGNSAIAKACQKNSWIEFQSSNGSSFADGGACVSYGAVGGALFGPSVTATDLGCVSFGGVPSDEWALSGTGFTPGSALLINGNHAAAWVFDATGSYTAHFIFDGPGSTASANFVDGNGVHASVTFGPSIAC